MTLSAGFAGVGSAAAQPGGDNLNHGIKTSKHGTLAVPAKMKGLDRMTGRRAVFVQFSGSGAAAVSQHTFRAASGNRSARADEAQAAALQRRADVRQQASAALAAAKQAGHAQSLFVVTNAVPGAGMVVDRAAVRALAQRSDVVKISAIVPKTASNAYPAQLTRVLDTWQNTGTLGKDITVGVIDTGIDYTHQDFGGDGNYAAAKASASSKLFDWRGAQPSALQAKVAGGWDFVGDDYNADPSAAGYQPVPHPDPNPLDCNEHGTHVAGTVAGYGENADGSTFTGDYSQLTANALNGMKIGPGMAPEAKLYALKVFGCDGSTDVVIPALDAALDPNGDGNFSDHLDVVNMSLGSDYATPDDPENAVIDSLAANGVLPVIAMGNGGDLTDIGGSPGNAVRSLAVASSVDAYQLLSGIEVNAPSGLASPAVGQVSDAYDWSNSPDVTGDVVELSDQGNLDGCDPLNSTDAAAVNGKIAWLTWDSNDASRRCGSAARSANVKAAGAIGAIFTGDVPVFGAGILGDPDIPVFQLTKPETDRLQGAADAGTLNVTFTKSLVNNQPSTDPSINDLVSSFSSRGTHGSIGVVKPDVAAPGDTIVSAGMGTGDGVLSISGTSMATPHTAGIGALVLAAHPGWSPEQVKAAIMNNADHDLYTGPDKSGDIYGPARDGAGRVDALSAVDAKVLAYDADVAGAVSASFGVVEAPINGGEVTRTRTIKVQNTGSTDATYDVSYAAAVQQPGVSYSFSQQAVTVPAGGSTPVEVTVHVDPTQLRHTIDPTMQSEQLGVARQFVADASGRMLLTPSGGGSPLRVPVYTAAKPVSAMAAKAGFSSGHGVVRLSGDGFAEGDGTNPADYTSLVSVMDFGASSPQLPVCAPDVPVEGCTMNQTATGGDIRYVGAGVSPDTSGHLTDGWLWFGLSTWGDSATLGNTTIPYVDFDTTGDGTPDYEAFVQNYPGTDVLLSWLVDLKTGDVLDLEPVNVAFGDLDTNVFDTDALLIPVWPKMIGVTNKTTKLPISYSVGTYSAYGSPANGGDIDHSKTVKFNAMDPKVSVDSPLWEDVPGAIGVMAKRGAKALVLHLHNASGHRAQVVTFPGKVRSKVTLGLSPNPVRHGRTVTATVRVAKANGFTAAGRVLVRQVGGTVLARGRLSGGVAKLHFAWKSRKDPRIRADYAGDANHLAGHSAVVKLVSR